MYLHYRFVIWLISNTLPLILLISLSTLKTYRAMNQILVDYNLYNTETSKVDTDMWA